MTRSANASRLLLRFVVLAGLLVTAWVIGVLFASTASADTGVMPPRPRPVERETTLVGSTTNSVTELTYAAAGVIHNAVPLGPTRSSTNASLVATTSSTSSPTEATDPTPLAAPPADSPPALAQPAAPTPVAADTPMQTTAAPDPDVKSAAPATRPHRPTKAPRTTISATHGHHAVTPAPLTPALAPDKPTAQTDGPQAGPDQSPQAPAGPSAPACPAAPGPAASSTHDCGGQARTSCGVSTARDQLTPPLSTGGPAARSVEPPGHVAGLPSSTPD
ncbi:hypothetical protein [Actinokineospora enzanensis]|uniref:hypothetical protein n=1 Tax=Actinokineospora enzanensis TaxID=155975 RepID=UPI0012EBA56A|nr:hypothetical protein [Actinokineospora enzanensis]